MHLADKGYMSAHNFARADRRGIELLGPMMPDNAWQSAESNGFAVSDFTIDWDNRVMTCPTGATSLPWANETDQGGPFTNRSELGERAGSCDRFPQGSPGAVIGSRAGFMERRGFTGRWRRR
ncbi:hypothetical protein [Nonomuraea sp. NPDC049480]|uniref:hypothetical protein n=1 Tax=Nonomuraea sp. NPDC049480 TaxID=3364353 RepID=UPI003799E72F